MTAKPATKPAPHTGQPRGVSIVHPAAGAPIEFLWWRDDGSCERREISPRYALQVAADLLVAARVNLAATELEK